MFALSVLLWAMVSCTIRNLAWTHVFGDEFFASLSRSDADQDRGYKLIILMAQTTRNNDFIQQVVANYGPDSNQMGLRRYYSKKNMALFLALAIGRMPGSLKAQDCPVYEEWAAIDDATSEMYAETSKSHRLAGIIDILGANRVDSSDTIVLHLFADRFSGDIRIQSAIRLSRESKRNKILSALFMQMVLTRIPVGITQENCWFYHFWLTLQNAGDESAIQTQFFNEATKKLPANPNIEKNHEIDIDNGWVDSLQFPPFKNIWETSENQILPDFSNQPLDLLHFIRAPSPEKIWGVESQISSGTEATELIFLRAQGKLDKYVRELGDRQLAAAYFSYDLEEIKLKLCFPFLLQVIYGNAIDLRTTNFTYNQMQRYEKWKSLEGMSRLQARNEFLRLVDIDKAIQRPALSDQAAESLILDYSDLESILGLPIEPVEEKKINEKRLFEGDALNTAPTPIDTIDTVNKENSLSDETAKSSPSRKRKREARN